jgi:hypothetical protein
MGCNRPPENTAGGIHLTLHLKFPEAMAPTTERFQKLLKRAGYLNIDLRSKSGLTKSVRLPVQTWSQLSVGELPFPDGKDDQLSIQVSLWDRTREETLRPFPSFKGSATLKAQQATDVLIKMTSQVSARDYD